MAAQGGGAGSSRGDRMDKGLQILLGRAGMDSGVARAEGDRGAAGSGENLGALERADALRPDWLSRSLTSITERLSRGAAGSEPGAGNGTRAVSFQLSKGQPGLYSFVLLAIKEQSSSWGETRADPASRGWHEGGTAPSGIWGWDRGWARGRRLGVPRPRLPHGSGAGSIPGLPEGHRPVPWEIGPGGAGTRPACAWGGAGTPHSRGHGKERGQRWNPPT